MEPRRKIYAIGIFVIIHFLINPALANTLCSPEDSPERMRVYFVNGMLVEYDPAEDSKDELRAVLNINEQYLQVRLSHSKTEGTLKDFLEVFNQKANGDNIHEVVFFGK